MTSGGHFAPLPDGFASRPVRSGQYMDSQVFGSITVGGTITGASFVGTDFYSDNWDGTIPPSLSSVDSTASNGFALDGSSGSAQFQGNVWVGGELRMRTGGVFATGLASDSRIEVTGEAGLATSVTLDTHLYLTSASVHMMSDVTQFNALDSERVFTMRPDVAATETVTFKLSSIGNDMTLQVNSSGTSFLVADSLVAATSVATGLVKTGVIHSGFTTGSLILAGGNATDNGANIELYGGSHGGTPKDAFIDAETVTFRNDAGTSVTNFLVPSGGGSAAGFRTFFSQDTGTKFGIYLAQNSATAQILALQSDVTSTQATKWYVEGNGDTNSTTGVYATISDERLKTDMRPSRSYWDDFQQVEFIKYELGGVQMVGVGAQTLQPVFPSLVKESGDGTLAVKSSILYGPIMGKVVQELQERIETLEEHLGL